MEGNKVSQSFVAIEEKAISQPSSVTKATEIAKPLLPGIIYGEIVYWIMLASMAIAVPGFIIYMVRGGGYFNAADLLNHLWSGSDCSTIWTQVGNVSQPLAWYDSLKLLGNGDMIATLGIAVTGISAVIGMWGAFLGMLRGKNGIYIFFALIIAIVLTLSAIGVVEIG